MEYRIGIDPGITGGLALLAYTGEWPELVYAIDMPVFALNGTKKQVNTVSLANTLSNWNYNGTQVFLELVGAMPGQGVVSMFNFGMSYGMVQGVVLALQLPLILVRPAAWKKRAGLLKAEKDAARTKVLQLFPKSGLNLKKDIGKADAILIAMFGR
jgi:crossover junction endodeoxyribonuclease RuvC